VKNSIIEFMGTPEAGKTTTIEIIKNKLEAQGKKVAVISEIYSRGPLKGMKNHTDLRIGVVVSIIKEIIETRHIGYDYILVDRGLYDRLFFNEFDFFRKKIDYSQRIERESFIDFSIRNSIYNPDKVFVFMVDSEVSLFRRGGEGNFVTKENVLDFNKVLNDFSKFIPEDIKVEVETTNMSVDEVVEFIFKNI